MIYNEKWIMLTSVMNDIEFGIIAGLLETAGIPVKRHVAGIDIVYGVPAGGIDILVPESMRDEAYLLINTETDETEVLAEEIGTEKADEEGNEDKADKVKEEAKEKDDNGND